MLWATSLLLALCSLVSADLAGTVLTAFERAVDCASCHALLIPVKGLAELGDNAFQSAITTMCQDLNVEAPDVCAGAVSEQGPIISHVLKSSSTLGQQGTKLCNALLGLCQPPTVNPYTVTFPKPAPTTPKSFKSTGKPPFQVTHFSDVHIDRQYTAGSEANCTRPVCCRNFAGDTGPVTQPAGPNGNGKCDSPVSLSDSMLQAINQFSPANKFSIFTGDVAEAFIWLVNQTGVASDLQQFNSEMSAKLGSPVYPVIGNHDAAPADSFPRNTTSASTNPQWVFDLLSSGWTQWIGAAAASQVDHISGSYSTIATGTNLRIISINTVYWYKNNFWLYDSDVAQPDPNGILAFLIQELQAAEDAGQRAWIIGHMPVGGVDALHDQSNYYDQIVQRYQHTIAAHFFGHSHFDQFEIAYSDYTRQSSANAVSISYIAPALTPRSGNPAFRVYDVDPDTFEIMDSRVYMSDMSKPSFQSNPTWELYYSARETYGPLVGLHPGDSLTPAFWHNLTEVFAANDTAFQLYNTFMTRGGKVIPCSGSCKTNSICDMRAMRAENNCDAATPGFHFKRDGSPLHHQHNSRECEGTNIGHIFSGIVALSSGTSGT